MAYVGQSMKLLMLQHHQEVGLSQFSFNVLHRKKKYIELVSKYETISCFINRRLYPEPLFRLWTSVISSISVIFYFKQGLNDCSAEIVWLRSAQFRCLYRVHVGADRQPAGRGTLALGSHLLRASHHYLKGTRITPRTTLSRPHNTASWKDVVTWSR